MLDRVAEDRGRSDVFSFFRTGCEEKPPDENLLSRIAVAMFAKYELGANASGGEELKGAFECEVKPGVEVPAT